MNRWGERGGSRAVNQSRIYNREKSHCCESSLLPWTTPPAAPLTLVRPPMLRLQRGPRGGESRPPRGWPPRAGPAAQRLSEDRPTAAGSEAEVGIAEPGREARSPRRPSASAAPAVPLNRPPSATPRHPEDRRARSLRKIPRSQRVFSYNSRVRMDTQKFECVAVMPTVYHGSSVAPLEIHFSESTALLISLRMQPVWWAYLVDNGGEVW